MNDLMVVWVPGGEEYIEDWDNPGWAEIGIDLNSPRFEWFLTRDACQRECDRRNETNAQVFRDSYDQYVQRTLDDNEVARVGHARAVREHAALVQAGLREPGVLPVPPPVPRIPESFERWSAGRNPGARWEPRAFLRAAEDHG